MSEQNLSFSVSLFPYDRWGGLPAIAQAAKLAEQLGYDSLCFPDHVIMPIRPDIPPVSTVWYDNFVLASHLATITENIRFIFNVMVVPYRPPVQLAKMISTLDVVSGGRLTLGIGAGWLKGEFKTLGIPFEERGAMTDDYLRAMKALWTEQRPQYEGKYTQFSNIAFEPKCVQNPHVPLWIGGSGKGPLRRAVELGDGWTPMVGSLDELKRDAGIIRERLEEKGRDPSTYTFAFGVAFGELDSEIDRARSHAADSDQSRKKAPQSPDEIADRINSYREIGFTHINISFGWETPADYMKQAEWFAEKVMPQFKGSVSNKRITG